HGDLHAGNMLVLEDGRHGLLDYGIVGRFDEAQRWALTRWLGSIATEDLPLQIEALGDLGAFPPGTDLDELAKQVEVVLEKIATEDPERLGDIAHDFELIARLLAAHGLRLPSELALFLKNLLHVTGQARRLAPEADPLAVAGVTAWADGTAGISGSGPP
ncbi:MAG: AarF/ABC1/UbiB kinase family protein, partial [Acidimicrobiia bacterium]|nr:AarF/ABC1/UbiB kinase family protein [Acidimicrobiia bacterium]